MTLREILDSVDIDNVLTIIENEVWKEENVKKEKRKEKKKEERKKERQ